MKGSKKSIKAKEFDRIFDSGEEVSQYLNKKGAGIRNPIQRINVDIPQEMLHKVDKEASRIGVPRTSLIKMWIAEHIDRLAS